MSHHNIYAQNPNWSVNSSAFPLDMQVVGAIKIDGKTNTQTNTTVAVFDEDNEIRGVANLTFFSALNKYVFFLTVYGNKGGDVLNFRVYDANLDKVILVPKTTLEFIPNKIIGFVNHRSSILGCTEPEGMETNGSLNDKFGDGTNFMNFTTNLRLQINRWQHLAFTFC